MKFGASLAERSVPQWRTYNIDYAQIKHLIKQVTTPGQGVAIAIPGRGDQLSRQLEDQIFSLLSSECNHVSLFVRSKGYEVESRLATIERKLDQLENKKTFGSMNIDQALRLRQRLSRMESDILKVGDEIRKLDRFSSANRLAVCKLTKKYQKWSGSSMLGPRVKEEILEQPSSFASISLDIPSSRVSATLKRVRTPFHSRSEEGRSAEEKVTTRASQIMPGLMTPSHPEREFSMDPDLSTSSTLQGASSPSAAVSLSDPSSSNGTSKFQRPPKREQHTYESAPNMSYWNEYDYPQSEAGEEFAILVDPDAPWFPGQKVLSHCFHKLNGLFPIYHRIESSKKCLHKTSIDTSSSSSADEDGVIPPKSRNAPIPSRGIGTYGTLPIYSVYSEQAVIDSASFAATPETSTLCFLAAFLILIISTFLTFTSRHKLRGEVDVAVVIAVISVLCFATVGIVRWWTVERHARGDSINNFGLNHDRTMLGKLKKLLSSVSDLLKVLMFFGVCIGSGVLLFAMFR